MTNPLREITSHTNSTTFKIINTDITTRGIAILNHGQITKALPELATPISKTSVKLHQTFDWLVG